MRGMPWTVEEEIQLKKLVEAKTPIDVIASTLGRQAPVVLVDAVLYTLGTTDGKFVCKEHHGTLTAYSSRFLATKTSSTTKLPMSP